MKLILVWLFSAYEFTLLLPRWEDDAVSDLGRSPQTADRKSERADELASVHESYM